MRVGIVSKPWLPVPSRAYGAIEKVVCYLACQLSQDRTNEVHLFAPGDSFLPARIRLHSLFSRGVGGKIDDSGAEIAQAMHAALQAQNIGLDILHGHSVDPLLAMAPFLKMPLVFSFYTFPNTINRLLAENAGKQVVYTFLSQAHRKGFPWIKKAHVVPPGVNLENFPFAAKKNDYLVFVGSINPHKGVIEAIEIAEKAQIRLKIGGKIHECDQEFYEAEFLPQVNQSSWAEFLGELTEQQRNETVKRAQALLFPIKWDEPFGLVQIEALAVGTPVIAFNRGAVPEVIDEGKTGYIVENISQAVRAVKNLHLISPQMCRTVVKRKFNAKNMATHFRRIYQQAISCYQ